MYVTITLLMYWSIAAALVIGGIFSLKKGFDLIISGQGRTPEQNQVQFFSLKATVGSLGAFVMVTACLWGLAASWTLPDYKDSEVEILSRRLARLDERNKELTNLNHQKSATIVALTEAMDSTTSLLSEDQVVTALSDQYEVGRFADHIREQRVTLEALRSHTTLDDINALEEYSKQLHWNTIELYQDGPSPDLGQPQQLPATPIQQDHE